MGLFDRFRKKKEVEVMDEATADYVDAHIFISPDEFVESVTYTGIENRDIREGFSFDLVHGCYREIEAPERIYHIVDISAYDIRLVMENGEVVTPWAHELGDYKDDGVVTMIIYIWDDLMGADKTLAITYMDPVLEDEPCPYTQAVEKALALISFLESRGIHQAQ